MGGHQTIDILDFLSFVYNMDVNLSRHIFQSDFSRSP